MNIIIADDSEMLRKRIKESIMDIKSVEVVGEADNGIEALNIITEKNPDFVILDLQMPGLNGIEVLKKIKEFGLKIVVCIFTNYPYPQYKEKCIKEGADFFLDKNINLSEIRKIIKDMMKTKQVIKA